MATTHTWRAHVQAMNGVVWLEVRGAYGYTTPLESQCVDGNAERKVKELASTLESLVDKAHIVTTGELVGPAVEWIGSHEFWCYFEVEKAWQVQGFIESCLRGEPDLSWVEPVFPI